MDYDILIVGSGPSGAHSAWTAVHRGFKVAMIDVGYTEHRFEGRIPDQPFSHILKNDPHCRDYLLGKNITADPEVSDEVGGQLTPPRQYILKNTQKFLPIRSENFRPLQSLALGGLAAGWGAGAATYEDWELKKCGLAPKAIRPFYEEIAGEIGVSGSKTDDISPFFTSIQALQPPLQIDSNGETLLNTYEKKRDQFLQEGFRLGRPPLAILTQSLGDRQANPYHDMDFYHDPQRSLYRPGYTVEALKESPNFTYLNSRLVESFDETGEDAVTVRGRQVNSGETWQVRGRRLLLAAGAINTARIVLRSLNQWKVVVPILCNPYTYIPALHWAMVGKNPRDRRHSMAQLTGLYFPEGVGKSYVRAQFYSYRSLLPERLAQRMPLPRPLGKWVARRIQNCLWLVGVTHEDDPSPLRYLELCPLEDGHDYISIQYQRSPEEKKRESNREKRLLRQLRRLKCLPLTRIPQVAGSSIHYAGTLPFSEADRPLTCAQDGKIRGTQNVYAADGSPFLYLAAKDFAFTLMANARRVAQCVVDGMKRI